MSDIITVSFIAGALLGATLVLLAQWLNSSSAPKFSLPPASNKSIQVLPANATGAVITCQQHLQPKQRAAIQEMVAQGLSKGTLVLEGGLQLSAVFVSSDILPKN